MFKDGKFSLWCDFLEREFIENEFKYLIEKKIINGATSNPAIFKAAILTSNAYKSELNFKDKKDKYENFAIVDIKNAANALLLNYANDDDGFVSIEVDPNLCDDEDGTFNEGVRLYNAIKMPNVMIKVPANLSGYKAIKRLIAEGINVNATLIFSPTQTKECLKAIKEGNELYKKRFGNSTLPKAVISIFVSRFDRLLDSKFEELNMPKAKFGVYNATYCYHLIEEQNLENTKALFASTGVKGDDLNPSYYIKELMFKNSINTAPLGTIKEFIKENGKIKKPIDKDEIMSYFKTVKDKINIDEIYDNLLKDGLEQFCLAFNEILKSIK